MCACREVEVARVREMLLCTLDSEVEVARVRVREKD